MAIDPDVQAIIDALEVRVAAIETANPFIVVEDGATLTQADGTQLALSGGVLIQTGGMEQGNIRPAYNTGTGFFVGTDNKLYDKNGVEFRMRGLNCIHLDTLRVAGGETALALTKANAVRYNPWWGGGTGLSTAAEYVTFFTDTNFDFSSVPVIGLWTTHSDYGSTTLTGSTSAADLTDGVDQWIGQKTDWDGIEDWAIINIANEWGPGNRVVSDVQWRDNYITEVARMRTAGFTHCLMIDAGGIGQSYHDIVDYGQAIFDSDPQKNIVFSWHAYNTAPIVFSADIFNDWTHLSMTVTENYGTAPDDTTTSTRLEYVGALGSPLTRIVRIFEFVGVSANRSLTVDVWYKGTGTFRLVNDHQGVQTNASSDITATATWQQASFNVVNGAGAGDTQKWGISAGTGDGALDIEVWTPTLTDILNDDDEATHIGNVLTLLDATGLPYVVGEYIDGNGLNNSNYSALELLTAAEAHGVGHIAWTWMDSAGLPDTRMTVAQGVYTQTSDLTAYGQTVIENETHGLQALAVPATIF